MVIALTLAINIIVTLIVLKTHDALNNACTHDFSPAFYSPAENAIEWEWRQIDAVPNEGPFSGDPSADIDAAWVELMQGINLKIYPNEMEKLGLKSLEFKDGSGYVGGLSVYHELHCIKRIRHWLYKDHYFPNLGNASKFEQNEKWFHVVHCLEHLRQTASCRGDISVIPYRWVYLNDSVDLGFIGPTQSDAEAMHRCVNWDRLHAWAKERRVDLWNYRQLLVNDWVE